MDSARADALAARSHLATQGWIARGAESFRHLPPPDAALWLGDAAAACDASPLEGGWKLHPMLHAPRASVDARWLDAADSAQRQELMAGLPPPGDDEAAPFAWAHRALVRQGLRLRVGAATGEAGTAWLHLERRPSAAVEALRFQSLDATLPGAPGGVLGALLAQFVSVAFGFTGQNATLPAQ